MDIFFNLYTAYNVDYTASQNVGLVDEKMNGHLGRLLLCRKCEITLWEQEDKLYCVLCADSKGNPRNITNSKGKKRRPNSKELSTVLKTNDALFLDFIKRCLTYVTFALLLD